MRITKEYETKLNLTIDEIYSGGLGGMMDVEDNSIILDKLRTRFEGRCKDSSFIEKVLKIKRRSMVNFDKSELSGTGSVYVTFIAEAIIYPINAILVGCEVKNVERNGKILCEYDNAYVYIKGDVRFSINIGGKIITQVLQTCYPTDEFKMTIPAKPFVVKQDFELLVTDVPEKLTGNDKEEFKNLLRNINNAEKRLQSLNKKEVKFFTDLFYPFKASLGTLPKQFKLSDIKNILTYYSSTSSGKNPLPKNDQVILSRHSMIPKHTSDIFIISKSDAVNLPKHKLTDRSLLNVSMKIVNFVQAILMMSYDYISYIDFIANMVDVYNSDAVREEHKNLWAFYEKYKK